MQSADGYDAFISLMGHETWKVLLGMRECFFLFFLGCGCVVVLLPIGEGVHIERKKKMVYFSGATLTEKKRKGVGGMV